MLEYYKAVSSLFLSSSIAMYGHMEENPAHQLKGFEFSRQY